MLGSGDDNRRGQLKRTTLKGEVSPYKSPRLGTRENNVS